jgi:signal transduction histidine kinase
MAEHSTPSFMLTGSSSCGQLGTGNFDLAVVGGVAGETLGSVMEILRQTGRPVIHVSRLNGHSPQGANLASLPEVQEWPELMVLLGTQILEREKAAARLAKLAETNSQLEQEATLGRYMLEVRHNLNNALTSILGNSDLMLLDGEALAPGTRSQVETIRNMGMRLNEIMQRFSSLQKEMQLMESGKKTARQSAG